MDEQKAVARATPCVVPWCIALATEGDARCEPHQVYGDRLRPAVPDPTDDWPLFQEPDR